eukprot:tig00000842_g4850.t1
MSGSSRSPAPEPGVQTGDADSAIVWGQNSTQKHALLADQLKKTVGLEPFRKAMGFGALSAAVVGGLVYARSKDVMRANNFAMAAFGLSSMALWATHSIRSKQEGAALLSRMQRNPRDDVPPMPSGPWNTPPEAVPHECSGCKEQ